MAAEASRTRGINSSFDQPAIMATVLGSLFLAGASIGALSLALPHPSEYDSSALWSNVAISYVSGLAVLLFRQRLPVWAIQVCVLAGTIVVTRAVYYGHDPSGYYTFWYLWIGVFAFFFFGPRWGVVHVGAVGAAYAWVLTEVSGPTPVPRWLVTVGSILVAGLLVDGLTTRLRRETTAAARRASNMEAVSEVARQLATQSDSQAVGWAICSAAVRTAGASAAVLWRPTISGDALQADAAAGAQVEGLHLPFVTHASGAIQVFTSAEDRFESLRETQSAQELAPTFEASAALWEPVLKDEGAAVGVLAVYWRDGLEQVSSETRRAIGLLALEAAIAIDRGELLGRLEIAARTDDLTGLLNRRAWDEEVGRELASSSRSPAPGARACVPATSSPGTGERSSRSRCPAPTSSMPRRCSTGCEGRCRRTKPARPASASGTVRRAQNSSPRAPTPCSTPQRRPGETASSSISPREVLLHCAPRQRPRSRRKPGL